MVVASYDLIRRIHSQNALLEHSLSDLSDSPVVLLHEFLFDVVVADEAHCLRNPRTELYNSISSLKVSAA